MIRDATAADLPGILAIYNDVIATSTAVYADDPVPLDERRRWLEARRALGYPVLVAVDGDAVVGFASFGDFRAWPGYRHSCEQSVHVRADQRGMGVGRRLVEALFPRAEAWASTSCWPRSMPTMPPRSASTSAWASCVSGIFVRSAANSTAGLTLSSCNDFSARRPLDRTAHRLLCGQCSNAVDAAPARPSVTFP